MNLKDHIQENTWWYSNCKRQRKRHAKICQNCPFIFYIKDAEKDIKKYKKLLDKLKRIGKTKKWE